MANSFINSAFEPVSRQILRSSVTTEWLLWRPPIVGSKSSLIVTPKSFAGGEFDDAEFRDVAACLMLREFYKDFETERTITHSSTEKPNASFSYTKRSMRSWATPTLLLFISAVNNRQEFGLVMFLTLSKVSHFECSLFDRGNRYSFSRCGLVC